MTNSKLEKSKKRKKRVREKVLGTKDIPRLSVFRSNRHLYAQLIDDEKRVTLVSVGDKDKKKSAKAKKAVSKKSKTAGKMERAKELGKLLAEKATKKKIKKARFDRGGYKYHGRVKALAEGAREGGLKF